MGSRLKNRLGDDLERLIKGIGDCKSKSEEDRIIFRAMESTKASVKSGKIEKQRTKDFLIKLLYFEMLGHDGSFGHFLAVQACGSNAISTKLVGYLAVAQFLDSADNLILLLVNTWRSDLQNDNHIIVCAALTAVCKLVNSDAIAALVGQVVALTSHPKEGVRKKAIMAMHRFCQIDPLGEGGMAGIDAADIFRRTLCDKDPAVMAATLCALYELAKHDPYPYRNLIPSLTSIAKQVVEHRLSKTYEYHHCPAPFIQMRLLRLMGLLGAGDRPSTENMRNVLLSVIKLANPRNNIGFAVLFECIRTITTVSPDTLLLEAAAKAIFAFLRTDNTHNLKYMGLDALGGIVSINFRQAQEHQTAVMDCLEDPDDTLKLKTLELLYKMTTASNVQIVVEKLIQYLHTCTDEHIISSICQKVSVLAEKYAPETLWYVKTVIEMFEVAGDVVPSAAAHSLMKLVAEQEEDLHKAVVMICLSLVQKPKLPQSLLQVICWVLGEYGTLVERMGESGMTLIQVQEKMCDLIQISNPDEALQGYVLTALMKLTAAHGGSLAVDAEDLLRKSLASRSTDLQQRAMELQAFLTEATQTGMTVLPFDASCEDLTDQLPDLQSLSFLDGYVQTALQNGAAPYTPESERDDYGVALTAETEALVGGLRYDAYQTPVIPTAPVGAFPSAAVDPEALSEIPAATSAAESDQLKLAVKSRKWGPAEPEVQEPPMIHVNNVKLEYCHPKEKTEAQLEETGVNGSAELTERDVLKASLFGGDASASSSRSKRFGDRNVAKSVDAKPKAALSAPAQKSELLPEVDLLDLSDPQDSVNTAQTAATDPFAHLDLLSGPNGLSLDSPAPAPQTAPPSRPMLDLDALYGPSSSTVMSSFPPIRPPHVKHGGLAIKTGMSASMPAMNKPTATTAPRKDDPFKDLLS